MKYYILLSVFFTGVFGFAGEYSEKDLKRLSRSVEIAGVRTDTVKNDDREKSELIEVNTFQDQDEKAGFQIRMVVELTDKQKKTYLVEVAGNQKEGRDSEYTGEDYWELRIPYGDLESVKISGYAIQYGIMDDGTFVLLAEEFDDVDSIEELKARTSFPFPGRVRLSYSYMYDDAREGEEQTVYEAVKLIK
ncbi:MAG: hypothetical protein JEZ10_06620 [Verrucomicrobia bacterium]|nr:hypothetical protein [Verrucomicrobiota bacterium]